MTTLAQDLGGVVRPEDLKFSEYPGRISGGMSVGMPKGVMAVHLPTGIKVVCNHHRNQHFNRDACIRAIEAAIQERTHSAEIAGALRDAERWQPIESAPNGEWFLAHSERGWIGLARRADPDYAPGEGWFEDEHTEYLNPAWLTHWRPLPAPPTEDSAMQQGGGGE